MKSASLQLSKAFSLLQSGKEVDQFLKDLCTPQEYEALQGRWEVAQLVDKGIPYRKIYELTGVSTATVTRVAQSLARGFGGYRTLINRMKKTKKD